MAATTKLALITPGGVRFEGDVEIVVAPGAAGDLGVLAKHAPLLTTLRPGVLKATVAKAEGAAAEAGGRLAFAVPGGFMQVTPEKVIVLADVALTRDEVNVEEARADLRSAQEELARKRGPEEAQARRAMAWAQARLDVTQRPDQA
jgi:F-type H+-transporting ATPase subunit epsilon